MRTGRPRRRLKQIIATGRRVGEEECQRLQTAIDETTLTVNLIGFQVRVRAAGSAALIGKSWPGFVNDVEAGFRRPAETIEPG